MQGAKLVVPMVRSRWHGSPQCRTFNSEGIVTKRNKISLTIDLMI